MIKGQLLIYHFNNIDNAKNGVDRNIYSLRDVNAVDKNEFQDAIRDALDEVPPGRGYVMIKWEGRIFIAEQDVNNPERDYIRHQINWHPLMDKFTI